MAYEAGTPGLDALPLEILMNIVNCLPYYKYVVELGKTFNHNIYAACKPRLQERGSKPTRQYIVADIFGHQETGLLDATEPPLDDDSCRRMYNRFGFVEEYGPFKRRVKEIDYSCCNLRGDLSFLFDWYEPKYDDDPWALEGLERPGYSSRQVLSDRQTPRSSDKELEAIHTYLLAQAKAFANQISDVEFRALHHGMALAASDGRTFPRLYRTTQEHPRIQKVRLDDGSTGYISRIWQELGQRRAWYLYLDDGSEKAYGIISSRDLWWYGDLGDTVFAPGGIFAQNCPSDLPQVNSEEIDVDLLTEPAEYQSPKNLKAREKAHKYRFVNIHHVSLRGTADLEATDFELWLLSVWFRNTLHYYAGRDLPWGYICRDSSEIYVFLKTIIRHNFCPPYKP